MFCEHFMWNICWVVDLESSSAFVNSFPIFLWPPSILTFFKLSVVSSFSCSCWIQCTFASSILFLFHLFSLDLTNLWIKNFFNSYSISTDFFVAIHMTSIIILDSSFPVSLLLWFYFAQDSVQNRLTTWNHPIILLVSFWH